MEARRSLSDKYNNEIRGSLHTASDDTLAEAYISSKSRWTDTQWVFDCETPGATRAQYKISWNVQLTKGGTLCDPEHSDLLSWLKRFAWSLFAAPGDNAHAHQPTSAGPLSVGLRYFALWMVDTGRNRPSELDPEALREYCDDLRTMRLIQDDGTDEVASAPSFTAVYNRVRIPILIWQQRSALRAAGIEPPPREPFDGRSASSLSAEITTDRLGWIRPLPDEVAIKVLNAAHEFLDVPAQDILDLQEQYLTARGDDGYPVVARTLANFQFQCYPRERRPWHPPLKNNGRDRNSTNEIRQLVRDLTCACALVIQGTSGMRISEVCGLPAGIESDTGLPTCVRIEDSPSGLNELFIVRTRLAKTEQSPRSVDWVLGMRPKVRERQAETWPPAVHAITILNRLLAPYRELIDSHDLFISFQNSVGLPKISEAICQINGETLLRGMRDFAARYVNWSSLPDESSRPFERNDLVKYKESQGRIIRSHQWRKFFANFAIRIDPSLLPTLQMHFHHVSIAMTEGGYVGRDPALLDELDSARSQMTALGMYEIAHGQMSLKNMGPAGDQVRNTIYETLRPRIEGQSESVAWRETIRFQEEFGAVFSFSPYATCAAYMLPEMRCHEEAGTMVLARWRHNLQPNYQSRRPELCGDCPNAMFDRRHRPFWVSRYATNKRAVEERRYRNDTAGLRVFEANMLQARNVLRQMGEDVEALDSFIDAGMDPTREVYDG